ncbi:MAG: VOC family protein [Pseudomonadales bacterium]
MNKLAHFDIHATNTEELKEFYGKVFDWNFSSYPDADEFFQVRAPDGAVIGAIAGRKYNPDSKNIYGFECSITVDDVEATINAVEQAGGKTLMQKTNIPNVGCIAKFLDPDGNMFCAIKYDEDVK